MGFDAEKLDYYFGSIDDEEELLKEINQEYTELSKIDYFVDDECKLPLSFTQIKNVEQGIIWYKYYHPEILDDIIEMLARYQFGKMPIKHSRWNKKNKKKSNGTITISRELTTLTFDSE